jgi:hypothetical protein
MVNRVIAVEYIRRMRGGAQAHMLGCSDGHRYVVKFQNNPQGGAKILANELFGTALAKHLGLPTPATAVVDATEIVNRHPEEMTIQVGRGRHTCSAGLCFGSQYPAARAQPFGKPVARLVYDFLPNITELPVDIMNVDDFLGMLVFDKWTCNTDGRQVIYVSADGAWQYVARMIDNGFCFNAGEWSFPDAPIRGLYVRPMVYRFVTGLESFEPWLDRLEQKIDRHFLECCASEIPPEWYGNDCTAIEHLVGQLERRRARVRELLVSAWQARWWWFPNWTQKVPPFLIDFRTDWSERERAKAKSA